MLAGLAWTGCNGTDRGDGGGDPVPTCPDGTFGDVECPAGYWPICGEGASWQCFGDGYTPTLPDGGAPPTDRCVEDQPVCAGSDSPVVCVPVPDCGDAG